MSELDLETPGTFVQEYVRKPLLIGKNHFLQKLIVLNKSKVFASIDGHKFDIGVYTIITSIEPLRVYIYDGDILFR